MVRAILSVIVGYVVMAVVVMVALSTAFAVLGVDGAFRPGTYDITTTWAALAVVVGLAAGAGGGFVCAKIARAATPPKVLAGVVAVLGLVMAVGAVLGDDAGNAGPRGPEVTTFEAASKAREPGWLEFAHPVVGVIGVLVGARLGRGKGAGGG